MRKIFQPLLGQAVLSNGQIVQRLRKHVWKQANYQLKLENTQFEDKTRTGLDVHYLQKYLECETRTGLDVLYRRVSTSSLVQPIFPGPWFDMKWWQILVPLLQGYAETLAASEPGAMARNKRGRELSFNSQAKR